MIWCLLPCRFTVRNGTGTSNPAQYDSCPALDNPVENQGVSIIQCRCIFADTPADTVIIY